MSEHNPFELESGLPEGVATTENARFAYDPNYQDGEVLMLMLDFKFADPDQEEYSKNYSLGSGWETNDRGRTVEHESGSETKNFNKNSAIGELITAMLGSGAEEEMQKRWKAGVGPRHAEFFDGWTFYMENVERSMKIRGEEVTFNRFLPREGSYDEAGGSSTPSAAPAKKAASKGKGKAVAGDEGTSTAPAKKAPAKKAPAKEAPVVADESPEDDDTDPTGPPYTITDEVRAQLREIADEAETPGEFQERAYLDIEAAVDDEGIQAAIEDLESEWSIWREAVEAYEAANS